MPHNRRLAVEKLEWLVLVALFLLAGVIGHDPWWKHGETYSFGIIAHFYQSGAWLIPTNAGVPFMEKPPLFFWTGAIMCHLFGHLLPLADAARMASVFYMLVTCFFMRKLSLTVFARHPAHHTLYRISLCLLLGSYGLVQYAHALSTDIALMAGMTIAMYGMALIMQSPLAWRRAGWWIGIGAGVAFLSKGLVMPAVLGVSGLMLYGLLPALRNRDAFKAIAVALLVASPFLFIWPAWLYHESPALFREWFWVNNIGRFLGFSVPALGAQNKPFYFLYAAPVFAFPVFPLACMECYYLLRRKEWQVQPLPLAIAVIGMLLLLVSASGRRVYLVPLFPVFSLLAATALLRFSPRFLAAWNQAVRIVFTLIALGTWLLWWNLLYPAAARPLPWFVNFFSRWLPLDFALSDSQGFACMAAIMALLLWLASWRFTADIPGNTARIWFTGAALSWCTAYTLLLPWIDETSSYRSVFKQMALFIQASPYAHECVGHDYLDENIAPMLEYQLGKTAPTQNFNHFTCPLLVTVAVRAPKTLSPHWQLVWHGERARPHDIENEELRLYWYDGAH